MKDDYLSRYTYVSERRCDVKLSQKGKVAFLSADHIGS